MRRILCSGILGLLLSACGGSSPPPTPTTAPPTLAPLPTATFGPSPTSASSILIPILTPTAGGSDVATGDRLVVINTEGDGANMRTDPSRNAQSIVIVPEGETLDIVGPDRAADGISWRNVRDRLGNTGWMSAGFLGPPGSQSTVPTRPPVTRAPTAPAKPAAPAKPTAPAKPAVTATAAPAAQPTAATKSQPTAAAAAGLAVQANVSRPTIASGSQGLHVRVTNGGTPVPGARVVAVVQDQ